DRLLRAVYIGRSDAGVSILFFLLSAENFAGGVSFRVVVGVLMQIIVNVFLRTSTICPGCSVGTLKGAFCRSPLILLPFQLVTSTHIPSESPSGVAKGACTWMSSPGCRPLLKA